MTTYGHSRCLVFPPAPRQPYKTHQMGVRIEVAEGEPIGYALRRFRRLLSIEDVNRLHFLRTLRHIAPSTYRRSQARNREILGSRFAYENQMAEIRGTPRLEWADVLGWDDALEEY